MALGLEADFDGGGVLFSLWPPTLFVRAGLPSEPAGPLLLAGHGVEASGHGISVLGGLSGIVGAGEPGLQEEPQPVLPLPLDDLVLKVAKAIDPQSRSGLFLVRLFMVSGQDGIGWPFSLLSLSL